MSKNVTFHLVQNAPLPDGTKRAPDFFTEQEMSDHFGRDRDEALFGLFGEGKTVKKINFAVGETSASKVSDLLVQGVMGEIDAAFRPIGEDAVMSAIASVYNTNAKNQSLAAILGGDEDFREWLGDRQSNMLQSIDQTVVTQDWERTWYISRNAFEDDQSGLLRERIQTFGAESNAAVGRIFIDMYTDAETVTHWVDGQLVCDTDHNYGTLNGYSTNQSNKSTTALSTAEIETRVAAMGALKGFNGNGRAGKGPTAVLANPTSKPLVMESFLAPVFYSAAATTGGARGSGMNWLKGQVAPENLIFHGNVTAGDLFLIEKRPVAPVIMMQRSDVPDEYTVIIDPQHPLVFGKNLYAIGERRRFGKAYGHWDCVFGIFP